MEKRKSLVKNLGWQTAYQIIATCMPLITSPYLSRVLGAEMIGNFSYTYSLALFFRMFALLGNSNYGTREISKLRFEKEKRSIFFKQLLSIQTIATLISFGLYFLYCSLAETKGSICYIQSIWIVDCFVNISWLYSGMEEFKYTSIRGVFIKVFQLLSIILFVKNENHLGRYAFIMSISAVLSNLILWMGIHRIIDFKVKTHFHGITKHLRSTFVLFLPVAAASVFHLMDKLMLGRMSTPAQSGYYYNSDHLVNIPILIISGLCTVMLSRMSHVSSDKKQYNELFETYSEVILIIGIAMACGIGAISNEFVPFFFGSEFKPCIQLVYIFSIVMIVKSLSNIMMSMHLIPTGKDKVYVIAVIGGAVINLIFNTLFIWYLNMGALGATLGTLIAEIIVSLIELIMTKKDIGIWKMLKKIIPYTVIGIIMFVLVRLLAHFLEQFAWNIILTIVCEVLAGAIVFIMLTFLYLISSGKYKKLKKVIIGGM